MSYDVKASDHEFWMRHLYRTSLSYQTEEGRAFTASGTWEIEGGNTDYLEFIIPAGKVVRIYNRMTVAEGDIFDIDLCSVTSITAGTTELLHTNMRVGGDSPTAKIYRGATNPVGLEVKETSMLIGESGPRSSGGVAEQLAYRVLDDSASPSILRIINTSNTNRLFNIVIVYTEQDA